MARLPCSVCKAKVFHPTTKRELGDRKPTQKVACQTGAGCPKGTPETAHLVEYNERNERLMDVYRGVRAGVPPPYNDAVAREMLGFLGALMERSDQDRDHERMMRLMMTGGAGRTR